MIALLPVSVYFALQTDFATVQESNPNIWGLLVLLGLISGSALIAYVIASNMLPMNLLGLLGYVETILMVIISFFNWRGNGCGQLSVIHLFSIGDEPDYF